MTQVLLVDDDKRERELWRQVIERLEHDVVEAESGDEAIEILGTRPDIKIVITDTRMKYDNGIILLEMLLRTFDTADLPKVLVHSRENTLNLDGQFIPDLGAHVRDYFGNFARFALKKREAVTAFLLEVAPSV